MNALLVSHPCETLGVQLRASMPLYERSVGFAVLLPSTITLASPRKRGGGTADIIFWLAVQYSDSPTFTILKIFRAVTVGIVNASEAFMLALLSISIPFDPHQPFQNRTIPRSAPHSCLPCQRWGAVARKNSGDYRRDCLPLHRILPFPQSSQKYNHPLLRTTFFHPLSKVRCCPTNSTIGSL